MKERAKPAVGQAENLSPATIALIREYQDQPLLNHVAEQIITMVLADLRKRKTPKQEPSKPDTSPKPEILPITPKGCLI